MDSHNHERYKALLAEIASCQMEFKFLAKLTRNKEYFKKVTPRFSFSASYIYIKVDHIMDMMEAEQHNNGMWPTFWNASTGSPINSEAKPNFSSTDQ